MRVLVATDAWHPQVNGVVRTLTALARSARSLGVEIEFLPPDGFRSIPCPTYSSVRLAIPSSREIARRIESIDPAAIHIATEGTIGLMVRAFCIKRGLRFTTSYTTRFPEYISSRFAIPEAWTYAALRRFHAPASVTMISTASLTAELADRGFQHLGKWTRGVDTDLFQPAPVADLALPRPIFMAAGRVSIEKNLPAFLSLDLPGSKVVVGDGPEEAELRRQFPAAYFTGLLKGPALAAHLAAADVFVFPSRTDTFGLVQLEALACGTPVAAFPVTGPKDVIGESPVGALSEDLRAACMAALSLSREDCRAFALGHSWENSARQFIGNLHPIQIGHSPRSLAPLPVTATTEANAATNLGT
jgi:glycosyltransferase involved in cell wall biosynthesis